jgi:hypothetical protein
MSTIGIHKLMDVHYGKVGTILHSLIIYLILPKNTQIFTPKIYIFFLPKNTNT